MPLRPSTSRPFVLAAALALPLPVFSPLQDEEAPGPGVVEGQACALCHGQSDDAIAMRDRAGRGVAPFDLWRSTMMANAARDPFWRAVQSVEVAAAASRQVDIETKCLSCHAPLAARAGLEEHGTGSPAHVLTCEGRIGELARDGVSCVICHGMLPDKLGTPESFTAGFELDPWRRMFGPHADPFQMPMIMNTTFTPTQSDHVTQAKLCGTCHTVVTHALDADARDTDVAFHEQAPYLEWRNSIFSDEGPAPGPMARPCQACHVPTTDLDGEPLHTRIVHHPSGLDFAAVEERSPYGRHVFVGGNTVVLGMLRDHAEELGVQAPTAAFDATLAAARTQLEERTARLAIQDLALDGGALRFQVRIENRTGHKLPTGHPSRRMWLRVQVRDAEGQLLFASGSVDDTGRLLGADGAPLAGEAAGGPTQPHLDRITRADEVALFRGVMADTDGAPTHRLMRGATWAVDDRILPFGWSPDHADAPATRPYGTEGDDDFVAGSDTVTYVLDLAGARAATVEVDLLYQPLSARWVAELTPFDTPEVQRFLGMWDAADRTPVALARARVALDG